ncbi:MAG: magnesium chelatase domain-containing protein [Phycisphaerales bacterium]
MLARVQSSLLQGIDALPCEIEVDHTDFGEGDDPDKKSFTNIVGLPDAAVKESLERVRSAMVNSGYFFPQGRTIINLAPADVRKEGPVYDLPIAVGVLLVQGIGAPVKAAKSGAKSALKPGSAPARGATGTTGTLIEEAPGVDPRRFLFAGELALDGRLRPIKGAIALAALAKTKGFEGVIIPYDNAAEAAVVEGIAVLGARSLAEVVGLMTGHLEPRPFPAPDVAQLLKQATAPIDFGEIKGQETVKRAIVVAAAGGHNLVKSWPSCRHRALARQK